MLSDQIILCLIKYLLCLYHNKFEMLMPDFKHNLFKRYDNHDKGGDIKTNSDIFQTKPTLSSKPQRKLLSNIQTGNEEQKLPSIRFNLNLLIDHGNQREHRTQRSSFAKISLYNLQFRTQEDSNQSSSSQKIIKKGSRRDNKKLKNPSKQQNKLKNAYTNEYPKLRIFPSFRAHKSMEETKAVLPNLNLIQFSELLTKQDFTAETQVETFKAFYLPKKIFAKAVRFNKPHLCIKEHIGLMPILGKLKINLNNYIIMAESNSETLANLLQNYGPCSDRFIKQALRQIIPAISFFNKSGEHLHLLTTSSIYVSSYGNFTIDTVSCSKHQTIKQLLENNPYDIYPETLCNQQFNSKSQVWAIGNIILNMVLGVKLSKMVLIHPYNQGTLSTQKKQQLYWKKIQKKLKELSGPQSQNQNITKGKQQKVQQIQISEELYKLLEACLKFNYENRPTLQQLTDFQYFTN